MEYAYFIENTGSNGYRDNSGLFQEINSLGIQEEQIYIDTADGKEELDAILEIIQPGDILCVRSVIDLELHDRNALLDLLKQLQDFGIALDSVLEPFLNGKEYFDRLQGSIIISKQYLEIKRRAAYAEAKREGIVGRPRIPDAQMETAKKLYASKMFTSEEISKLSGVSTSSLYRYLKEQNAVEKPSS